MNRYNQRFKELEEINEIAFVPFTVLGYPSENESLNIVKSLIDHGADMLELGIPYSDPIADGPIIQQASHRALQNGFNTDKAFELLAKIRAYDHSIPIGLLVYSQIIVAKGIEQFMKNCADSGVDSILIADIPFHQREEFLKHSQRYEIELIFILAPNTSEDIAIDIQTKSDAYVYVVSRSGITGIDSRREDVSQIRKAMHRHKSTPHLLGFGISEPCHVKEAIDAEFSGIIVGSKIISLISKYENSNELNDYVLKMKDATRKKQVKTLV